MLYTRRGGSSSSADASAGDGAVTFYPAGRYDVVKTGMCVHPYVAHLRVRSVWQGSQRLTIDSATVTLQDLHPEALRFEDDDLPNPFMVLTKASFKPVAKGDEMFAVADCELIPTAYAKELTRFSGHQILVNVELHAMTSSSEPVDVAPFVYPIELCSGCGTVCASGLEASGMTREEAIGAHTCDDNSGNDDRLCIYEGC